MAPKEAERRSDRLAEPAVRADLEPDSASGADGFTFNAALQQMSTASTAMATAIAEQATAARDAQQSAETKLQEVQVTLTA